MAQSQENEPLELDSPNQENSTNAKKTKGLISRMKRSLSASGRPQTSTSSKYVDSALASSSSHNSNSSSSTLGSPSFMQQNFSHIPSNLSSPIPTSTGMKNSHSTSHLGPSPTTQSSYETFGSSSTSDLSVQSIPSNSILSRSSYHDTITSTPSTNTELPILVPKIPSSPSFTSLNVTMKTEKPQAKSLFESRSIENDKTFVKATAVNKQKGLSEDVGYAPAPAMYWSRPEMYGAKPPKLRAHASVVYDGKMFVYGGTSKNTCSDTLYVLELDTFTWSKPRVYGTLPPACRAHCLLVNPNNGRIYLFGGGDGQKYHNHFYMLDTHTMVWSRPKTLGKKPSERRAHISILWREAIYIFGGGDGTKALNDVHCLDLKTKEWKQINTKGNTPTCRGYHTGTLVGNKLVVFGGSDGKECFGGIHVLDLETHTWHPIHLDEHLPRLSHSAICVGSFLFILAGHDGSQYRNDLLMLNLVNMSWETRTVYGQAPSPRGYHTSVLYDSRIFLFGGYNGTSFSDDIHLLDLSSYAYLPQIVNFTIDTSHNTALKQKEYGTIKVVWDNVEEDELEDEVNDNEDDDDDEGQEDVD
ncbi:hypothetical protein [Parasitella parasitica]|uniref:Uncharacterized protein n=1 Tax=Parasitella parasitica TaxID=35722 RepID=A0A0B7MRF0_9FUNG|nr:hypothetical protein [Parasitella parasitica]